MSLRRSLLLGLVAVPALALAESAPTIIQRDKQFSVPTLEIPHGSVVRFVNDDDFRHNIALQTPAGQSRSGIVQAPGETTDIPFDQNGLYRVTCLIHPQMHMTVLVK